jgi:hypothetical protein
VGENLCQLYIRQGTDNQNIHRVQKLNSPNTKDLMNKWANELNRTFSNEDVQIVKKKTLEKMLTIPGCKGNANQYHTKIPPHSC